MSRRLAIRIFYSLFSAVMIFLSPWWISFAFIAGGFFAFENFYEGLLLGFMADMFFGRLQGAAYLYPFSLLVLIFWMILPPLKKRLIFY